MSFIINMPIATQDVANDIDNLEIKSYKFKVLAINGFKITVVEENEQYDEAYSVLKDYLKNKVGGGVFFNIEKSD